MYTDEKKLQIYVQAVIIQLGIISENVKNTKIIKKRSQSSVFCIN